MLAELEPSRDLTGGAWCVVRPPALHAAVTQPAIAHTAMATPAWLPSCRCVLRMRTCVSERRYTENQFDKEFIDVSGRCRRSARARSAHSGRVEAQAQPATLPCGKLLQVLRDQCMAYISQQGDTTLKKIATFIREKKFAKVRLRTGLPRRPLLPQTSPVAIADEPCA